MEIAVDFVNRSQDVKDYMSEYQSTMFFFIETQEAIKTKYPYMYKMEGHHRKKKGKRTYCVDVPLAFICFLPFYREPIHDFPTFCLDLAELIFPEHQITLQV